MQAEKDHIIQQLRSDILRGNQSAGKPVTGMDIPVGSMATAFPDGKFPLGAIHELVDTGPVETAATAGFVAALLAPLMQQGAAGIWIGPQLSIFPPALAAFGIAAERVLFIKASKPADILWTMEETLKCEGIAAVVAESKELAFNESRRLQLAVEASRVTGFVLRHSPRKLQPTACVARWRVSPVPSQQVDGSPGIGFPRWKVELQKIRNGRPGTWELEWAGGRLRDVSARPAVQVSSIPLRKTG